MKHAGAELSARVLPRAPLHPPLEGEGRRRCAAPEPGWGGSLREKTHPTPPLASLASTLPLQGRVSEHAARSFRHLALRKKSQRCAARFVAGRRMPFVHFPLPEKREGSRAPTGAGADTPHPMTCLAAGPISGSPEMTGP